ncbi:MAG: molybdopterin converting factor subunit 1 [Pseudomonadota bacterium]
MKLLYFAWVKTRIGIAEEDLTPPAEVATVGQLMTWLSARGEGYAAAFAEPERLRAAVNQSFAALDAPIGPGDEVAFFPPVTGG